MRLCVPIINLRLRGVRGWEILQSSPKPMRRAGGNNNQLQAVQSLRPHNLSGVRAQFLFDRRVLRIPQHHR